MPPRQDRRRLDKLLVACTLICVICTIATVGVVAPTVLDTSDQADDNRQQIDAIDRLTRRIAREGRERRDQSCKQDEQRHLDDVNRLKRTYAYLQQLPRPEWGSPITVAIVRQLPEIEDDARHDVAPKFCDEADIGLPEPDPVLPLRRDFSRLLRRQ